MTKQRSSFINLIPLHIDQVVLEQVYWKEKSKDDGVEGDGKALSRKQSLEQSRQNQEKV